MARVFMCVVALLTSFCFVVPRPEHPRFDSNQFRLRETDKQYKIIQAVRTADGILFWLTHPAEEFGQKGKDGTIVSNLLGMRAFGSCGPGVSAGYEELTILMKAALDMLKNVMAFMFIFVKLLHMFQVLAGALDMCAAVIFASYAHFVLSAPKAVGAAGQIRFHRRRAFSAWAAVPATVAVIGGQRKARRKYCRWRRRRVAQWGKWLDCLVPSGSPARGEAGDGGDDHAGALRDPLRGGAAGWDGQDQDAWRGGGGGLGAKVTSRRRGEKFMEALAELWASFGGDAAADDFEDEADPWDAFYRDLENLMRQRPKDPLKAFGKLLRRHAGDGQASRAGRDESGQWAGTGWVDWHETQDYDYSAGSASWGTWPQSSAKAWAGTSDSDQGAGAAWHAADDFGAGETDEHEGEWTQVSRRRGKPKGAAGPQDGSQRRVLAEEPKRQNRRGRGGKFDKSAVAGPLAPMDWQPRSEDWGPTTLLVKKCRDAIEADEDVPILAYPTSEDEFELFRTYVQAAPVDAAFSMVVLKGHFDAAREACTELDWTEQRLPGVWRNQLRVANAWVGSYNNGSAPALTSKAVPVTAPTSKGDTCVLRVHADACFLGHGHWGNAKTSPGPSFRKWAQAAVGRIHDTWSWELVDGPAGRLLGIQGLVRVPAAQVAAFLGASGAVAEGDRWFLQPLTKNHSLPDIPALTTDWVAWLPDETWEAYASRCAKQARGAPFGLACGSRNLGIRRPVTPDDAPGTRLVRRRWRITAVPRDWGFEQIEALLSQGGFGNVELREKMPWRGGTAWTFTAEMDVTIDYRVLSDGSTDFEVARLGRNHAPSEARALPMEWRQHFGSKLTQKERKESRRPGSGVLGAPAGSTAPPTSGAETGPTASDDSMGTQANTEAERTDDGKSGGLPDNTAPAKKSRASAEALRGVPLGMRLLDNKADGNCLFQAVADVLADQGRSKRSAMDLGRDTYSPPPEEL